MCFSIIGMGDFGQISICIIGITGNTTSIIRDAAQAIVGILESTNRLGGLFISGCYNGGQVRTTRRRMPGRMRIRIGVFFSAATA